MTSVSQPPSVKTCSPLKGKHPCRACRAATLERLEISSVSRCVTAVGVRTPTLVAQREKKTKRQEQLEAQTESTLPTEHGVQEFSQGRPMPEPDASTHLGVQVRTETNKGTDLNTLPTWDSHRVTVVSATTICISAGRLRNSYVNWRFRATLKRGTIEALFELFNYLRQEFGLVRVERDIRKCLMDLVQHSIAFREGDVLRSQLLYLFGTLSA